MRVSTANTYDLGINALQRRQSEMSDAQTRLTSGKRVIRASDDPVAASRAERALSGASRVDASQRSVEAARTLMVQTESSLGDAGELLQQAREAMLSAGNATYGSAERQGVAASLRGIRDQLFKVANRSDGAGTYLFGGQGSTEAPFVDSRPDSGVPLEQTGVRFTGSRGGSVTDAATNLPLALDGAAVWTSGRTGNGVFETRAAVGNGGAWITAGQVTDPSALTGASYQLVYDASTNVFNISNTSTVPPTALPSVPYLSGQAIEIDGMSFTITGAPGAGERFDILPSTSTLNVFGVLDKAVADLTAGKVGSALTQAVNDNLRNIDSAMGRLQNARATAGQALARVDSEFEQLGNQKLNHQTERSNAEDLDMVQAISDFQNKQSGYDAALKSYSMVQRMSLFQYVSV